MATAAAKKLPVSVARARVPPLESGDHLTAAEFERRYDAMPDLKKAELIEGVVYVGSPVSLERHGEPHADLMTWLGTYKARTPGVRGADNTTVRLDRKNEPQPDGMLFIDPRQGGRVRITKKKSYVVGGPEFVAEVAATSASLDKHLKRAVYERYTVQEYLIWRVLDGEIDWFTLQGDRFKRLALGKDGTYRSKVLPGLWLDPTALVTGDLGRVLDVLHAGLASPQHAAFVARLKVAD